MSAYCRLFVTETCDIFSDLVVLHMILMDVFLLWCMVTVLIATGIHEVCFQAG